MGRFIKQTGLILLAAIPFSCQKGPLTEVEPEVTDLAKRISVIASIGENTTRTSVYHDDEGARYVFQWNEGDRIDLVEAVPSLTQDRIAVYASEALAEPCELATFPTDLPDRELEGELLYVACYPAGVLQQRDDSLWDEETGGLVLPVSMPGVQHPAADSFDPAADLLVSKMITETERPEGLKVFFARLGTILKLDITGLTPGTRIHGGTLMLGYACQGKILYDVTGMASYYAKGKDGINFLFTEVNAETGEREGTPLVADANGKATVWLRIRSGIADQSISLLLDAEDETGEETSYSRFVNLLSRGKTVTFKEGGLTTLSVSVSESIPGDGVIPQDLKHLPAIYINTANGVGITSKFDWLTNTRIRIYGDDNQLLFEDKTASIRGRGNTTWYAFPKKPYYFKLTKKTDLLGTGKSKKYILLANWFDRTLLRNAVAFEAARRTSMEWTPAGIFVELYLNNKHLGNYLLVEKIEVESARLNADYLFSLDVSVDPSTGEDDIDFYTDGGYRPNTGLAGLPVEVKHPDRDDYPDGFEPVLNDAKALFDNLEQAISDRSYADVLDLDSFCDWYLVHELTGNLEPNHPKSSYLYTRNGKFYAGPVWDFDWETFLTGRGDKLLINNSIYYKDLFRDSVFTTRLRERWAVLKPRFEALDTYIDMQADWIRSSEAVNHNKWPINGFSVNQDEKMTFQAAVDHLKLSLHERIAALDRVLNESVFDDGSGIFSDGQDVVILDIGF